MQEKQSQSIRKCELQGICCKDGDVHGEGEIAATNRHI